MTIPEIGAGEWLSIITHLRKWVANLLRARAERKRQSREALRAVIKAVRETTLYLRSLREGGRKSIRRERELSLLWTELSFKIEDLGLRKLADRCSIKGRYWADPASLDRAHVAEINARLTEIEQLARASLRDLKKKRPR